MQRLEFLRVAALVSILPLNNRPKCRRKQIRLARKVRAHRKCRRQLARAGRRSSRKGKK